MNKDCHIILKDAFGDVMDTFNITNHIPTHKRPVILEVVSKFEFEKLELKIKELRAKLLETNGDKVELFNAGIELSAKVFELEKKLAEAEKLTDAMTQTSQNNFVLNKKLQVAVEMVESLRSLIELSTDSEYNYENWLEENLLKIKAK